MIFKKKKSSRKLRNNALAVVYLGFCQGGRGIYIGKNFIDLKKTSLLLSLS